jgi:hypothetical protein
MIVLMSKEAAFDRRAMVAETQRIEMRLGGQ